MVGKHGMASVLCVSFGHVAANAIAIGAAGMGRSRRQLASMAGLAPSRVVFRGLLRRIVRIVACPAPKPSTALARAQAQSESARHG